MRSLNTLAMLLTLFLNHSNNKKINKNYNSNFSTLTEDTLDIYGFCPVKIESNNVIFDNFIPDAKETALRSYLYYKKKNWQTKKI